MLIKKETHCFHCGSAGFDEPVIHDGMGKGYEMAVTICPACTAKRILYIGPLWPKGVQGNVERYEPKVQRYDG